MHVKQTKMRNLGWGGHGGWNTMEVEQGLQGMLFEGQR
jgi:hypothetical protein